MMSGDRLLWVACMTASITSWNKLNATLPTGDAYDTCPPWHASLPHMEPQGSMAYSITPPSRPSLTAPTHSLAGEALVRVDPVSREVGVTSGPRNRGEGGQALPLVLCIMRGPGDLWQRLELGGE
jgi:hypothetical protein